MISVAELSVTAVKATRLRSVESVTLGPDGAEGNRRFYLIDERGRMVNGKTVGSLQAVVASVRSERLALEFPDGSVVEAPLTPGAIVQTEFFSRGREARLAEGPWSDAISSFAGRPLRLVEADGDGAGVDRGRDGGVTLISRASLDRLAAEAGTAGIDPRRFRMLIEIDGVEANEEDAWVGRRASIGEAVVAFGGHVGRCLITSRDPDTGNVDLPTLDILRGYRGEVRDPSGTPAPPTELLPFGIYGAVVQGGVVRLGDKVMLR